MASSSSIEKQLHITFTADIEGHIYSNERTYILEPLMKKENSIIQAS